MALRDNARSYGPVTRLLHTAIVMLLAVQFALGLTIDLFAGGSHARSAWIGLHESNGILLLVLAVLLLGWRIATARPSLGGLPAWQRKAARLTHGLLYLALLAQPLLGMTLVITSGYPLQFYGLHFGPFMGADRHAAASVALAHEWTTAALAVLIAVHSLAALFHYVVRRDHILQRMWLGTSD